MYRPHPQIILIIGEPPIKDLTPLLTSLHFSSSLVLIATHTPPLIPHNTPGPAFRILRLSQPLAVHDSGALRLVNLLERAQRVAHLWPRDSSPHTMQLAQSPKNGDFSIVEPVSYLSGTTDLGPYPSPAPSTLEHDPTPGTPSKKLHRTSPSPKDKPNYKPFDAIINFIPCGLTDKAILKHAILVTTITSPFLAPTTYVPTNSLPRQSLKQNSISSNSSTSQTTSSTSGSTPVTSPSPSPPLDLSTAPTQSSKVKNRFSLLFRTALPSPRHDFRPLPEVVNLTDGSWKVKNAHLVHVFPVGWTPNSGMASGKRASSSNQIPRGQNRRPHSAGHSNGTGNHCKLVQSIEQFLLSFAYPLGSIAPGDRRPGPHPGTSLSSPASPASTLNNSLKTAQIISSTIDEESITPKPSSSSGLKGKTRAHDQEDPLTRASTLSTPLSTSNSTVSSDIDAPLKPVPYLLAPGIFGRCGHGSNRPHARSGSPSEYGVGEEATALSIGEIILLGALDFDHTRPGAEARIGRAWIGDVGDVVFADGGPYQSSRVGREVVVPKTAKRSVNIGLQTPPESLSSNNSAEGAEEEQPASTPGSRSRKRVSFNERALSPTLTTPTATKPKATDAKHVSPTSASNSPPLPKSMHISRPASQPATIPSGDNSTPDTRSKLLKRKSSLSTSTPTPTFSILRAHTVKEKGNSLSSLSSLPLAPAVQVPPLVVHRDSARSPRRSGDNHDLGLPVPPMMVSMKSGSRSASGYGMDRGRKTRSMYGEMRSSMDLLEGSGKGLERKGFVGALKKLGLWV